MPVSTLDHPTIFEVFDPELNLHSVMVRMSNTLAAKYPNKPWGTPLSDIVVKKYSDKFSGYILVAFEPVQGADDLFWIFQNIANARGWTTKSKTKDDLIPAKFKGQVVRVTTKTDVAPGTDATTLTGNLIASVVEQQQNTGKAVKSETTETIDLNVAALVGEEYGDIVTKSVSESLVVEGTAADTGIDVISSTVDPTGDGKAVRQTKRVKGGAWPDPLNKEVTKENGNNPPTRYLKDLTRTKVSRKIAPGSIPSNPTLSGNEVGRSYKNETPDRAEEIVTTQTLTLNTSSVDESREQKPFVSILSRMTPGTSSVLPATGNGSSSLVYEAPDGSKIYENTAQIATARPYTLLAGKDAKLGYRIEETDVYSTDPTLATKTGNVGVAFDDGSLRIYKKTQVRAYLNNVEFDSAAKNTKLFKETVHTSFKTSASGDDSKDWDASVAYSDGDLEVYRIDEVSITAKTPLVYYTAVNASMPSVLKSITIEPIERLPDSGGERRDKMCIKVVIEEGYSGLFKAKITEKYTEDPSEADSFIPLIFKPTRIDYDGLNFQVSIGETLHQQIIFEDTIGSGDPDYATGTSLSIGFRTFAATIEHASIPSGWQKHAIQVDPYKNGFLVKTIEIQYKA